MLRFIVPSITLLLVLPLGAQAASKKDFELSKMLEQVARESSVGTPRAINEDILDQGYTVEGKELIDHLSVRESHAEQMRSNPKAVYYQLGASVCRNPNLRKLMDRGAVMTYEFTEHKTNRPIATHRFKASDCPSAKPKK
ncbi:hypothetical protein D3C76_363640 [compost metagenome]